MTTYVHGYSTQEAARLKDQATTLAALLYGDLRYPKGATVLEAGCGTGCQTVFLAAANPETNFVSMDISPSSLATAQEAVRARGLTNVRLQPGNIFDLPLADQSIDHIFVCFVLEHLKDPVGALRCLLRALKMGGTITVIEGDHGSFYCHPETVDARRTVDCLVQIQAILGGDAMIGRRLYPLLTEAGFAQTEVEPRMVYVDGSRPKLIEGFSRNTFIAMVRGVRDQALALSLIDEQTWDKGIADMEKAAEPTGTFCYTFFRAVAQRNG